MIDIVSFVYGEVGGADKISYFQKTALTSQNKYGRLYSIYYYSNLLGNLMEPALALQGIRFIEDWVNVETVTYAKRVAISSLNEISESFAFITEDAQAQMKNDKTLSKEERLAMESKILNFLHVTDRAMEASERLSN